MKRAIFWLGVAWCGIVGPTTYPQGSGPLESLKRFSSFSQVDLRRMLDGEILAERGPLMEFPNGITAETCFVVPISAEETAKQLKTWDATPHEALKVHAFQMLHNPCEPGDFQRLSFKSNQHSIRWLLERTKESTPDKSELNLSRSEARELAGCVDKNFDPTRIASCWSKLLFARAASFQRRRLAGILPYETTGETILPVMQLRAMLGEQLQVAHEFQPILQRIGLFGSTNGAVAPVPCYYWTMFDADHHATISLGAFYELAVDDHFQMVDVEYYVSGNYYTSATLYEIWPIRIGNKSGSLVWRDDFFAAPMLRFTKGTERLAYGAIMLQEIKKEIRYFQDDMKIKQ
ncbi:MAG: hypothetical protein ABSC38_00075 [Verrucomicrobiia bacterium]